MRLLHSGTGIEAITFSEGRTALLFGNQKINLHEVGNEFQPNAANPIPGSADLCFLVSTPLTELIERLYACNVAIVEGPVQRTGATGPINSVYIRDVDGNLLELSNQL